MKCEIFHFNMFAFPKQKQLMPKKSLIFLILVFGVVAFIFAF